MKSRTWWTSKLATLLIACALSVSAAPSPAEDRLEPLERFPQGTLTILTPDARRHVFRVWIADTEARREQGLMFVKSLEPDTGMLFLFDSPRVITMWMKNTLIPLDMVFIDGNGHVTSVIENAKPMSLEVLSSRNKAAAVLELGGGVTRKQGIGVGAVVKTKIVGAQ